MASDPGVLIGVLMGVLHTTVPPCAADPLPTDTADFLTTLLFDGLETHTG